MFKSLTGVACAAAVVTLALFGCETQTRRPAARPPATPAPAVRPAPTPPQPTPVVDARPAPAAEAVQPAAVPVQLNSAGASRIELFWPTGSEANSVLRIRKTAVDKVQVNEDYAIEILIQNLTQSPLPNVVLTETISDKYGFRQATPEPSSKSGKTLTWRVGDLAPRQTKTFRLVGQAKTEGEITSCSVVTFEVPKLCITVLAAQPKLQLAKSAPAEALLADTIEFRYTVSNPGSGLATDVRVADQLPEGLRTLLGESTIRIPVGELKPGESRDFTQLVKASRTGTYEAKATATGTPGLRAEAQTTTRIVQPVLAIEKTGRDRIFVGGRVDYAITVANTGDGVARDTVVRDAIPAGMEFLSASHGGRLADGEAVWRIGNLNPGAKMELRLSVTAKSIADARNTATASAAGVEPVTSAPVRTQVLGIPGVLMEVVDLVDPVMVGEETTYVITVTNQGSADSTNIRIKAELEPSMEFVSATGPAAFKHEEGVVTFEPVIRLAPQARAVYRVVVRAVAEADARFKVEMLTDQLTRPVTATESTNLYR